MVGERDIFLIFAGKKTTMKYKRPIDNEPRMASEDLPSEYIRMALACTLDDERKGRLIPSGKVMEELRKKNKYHTV